LALEEAALDGLLILDCIFLYGQCFGDGGDDALVASQDGDGEAALLGRRLRIEVDGDVYSFLFLRAELVGIVPVEQGAVEAYGEIGIVEGVLVVEADADLQRLARVYRRGHLHLGEDRRHIALYLPFGRFYAHGDGDDLLPAGGSIRDVGVQRVGVHGGDVQGPDVEDDALLVAGGDDDRDRVGHRQHIHVPERITYLLYPEFL